VPTLLGGRRARVIAAVGVAAAVAVGVGVAWATIPASDGAINACYKDGTGDLRVVSSSADCRAHENAIALAGPTHGYAAQDPGDVLFSSSTSTTLLTLPLPAGKYLLHAKTNLMNRPASDAVLVPCDLRVDGTSTMLDQDRVVLEVPVTTEEASEANVPLQSSLVLGAPATVVLECAALTRGTSSTVDARYRQIDAITLAGLN
jgi:hypothetical protein